MLEEVRQLMSMGWRRYKIAEALGITEWEARKLIDKVKKTERLDEVNTFEVERKLDKLTISDQLKQEISHKDWNTYDLSKKFQKSPPAMQSLILKANGDFDPASDWVRKAAKNGVRLSYLKEKLNVKDKDKACEILQDSFPECFIIERKVEDDIILTPVFDSKNEIENINIDTSKKPFSYYVSPGNNYMLIKVDDNYGSNKLTIPGFSDIHVGSIHHRPELFEKLIQWTLAADGPLPLLNGDLTENITKQSVGNLDEQYLNPNGQVTEACKKIAPMAHLVMFSTIGNHEARTMKYSDFDQGAVIAQLLKVPYFINRIIVDIHWRGIEKRISATHKYGNSYSIAQIEASVLKVKQFTPAHVDAWFSGHNHKSFILPEESLTLIPGRGFEHVRWYILNNGSCVGRTGGYAEKYPPAPQDLVYLEIKEDGNIGADRVPISSV